MTKNKRKTKTLAQQVRWQLLWLGSGLFFAFLILIFVFAWRTTHLTTTSLMQLEAQSLVRQTIDQPHQPLPQGKTFSAYLQWSQVPKELRQHFETSPIIENKMIEKHITAENKESEYLYLLHYVDEQYGEIYLFSRHTTYEVETIFIDLFYQAIKQAFWLTLAIFIALFFLVRWLINRTTQPLVLLSEWASELNNRPEQQLNINFPLQELNQLATQLHQGVSEIQAYNQREQEFLKHASHELRTPLAIVQASLDTLALQNRPEAKTIVQRALKACTNMRHLSSALLWLARESKTPPKKERINVAVLTEQIVNNHKALASNRNIEVKTTIESETIEVEADLFFILLSNLIKNAFQYSSDGSIDIAISKHQLSIRNPNAEKPSNDDRGDIQSFGLGLQLVQRICTKMGWIFRCDTSEDYFSVTISWS